MDKTIEYYEKHFGLKKTRYRDIPEVSPLPLLQSVPNPLWVCMREFSSQSGWFSSSLWLFMLEGCAQEKYSNAFLAAGPEDKNFALELTYNYGKDSYNIGSGFGHFALRVEDVYKTVDSIKSAGGRRAGCACATPLLSAPHLHAACRSPWR